jgi:hypothetical protein
MHCRENDEAFLTSLDEAVHRVILELVELNFLSNTLDVEHDWGITHYHLESHFSYLTNEVYYSLVDLLLLITNAQMLLDFLHHTLIESLGHGRCVNLLPV